MNTSPVTRYPASNYKQIRSELKAEYKSLIEIHTALKRKGMDHWASYKNVRIKHIAYSMFKGSTFEQVEFKWREPTSSANINIKRHAELLYNSYVQRIVLAPEAVVVA